VVQERPPHTTVSQTGGKHPYDKVERNPVFPFLFVPAQTHDNVSTYGDPSPRPVSRPCSSCFTARGRARFSYPHRVIRPSMSSPVSTIPLAVNHGAAAAAHRSRRHAAHAAQFISLCRCHCHIHPGGICCWHCKLQNSSRTAKCGRAEVGRFGARAIQTGLLGSTNSHARLWLARRGIHAAWPLRGKPSGAPWTCMLDNGLTESCLSIGQASL
jgi:hypothetical protein